MDQEEDFAAQDSESFGKGNGKTAAFVGQQEEVMPHLPDKQEIALDYEYVRGLLAAKHNTAVGLDDPILMMVTLINLHLDELEKLTKRHNEALTKIMADQSRKYIAGVKTTTDDLGKVLAENSVEAIREIFNSHGRALHTNTNNAIWCAGIMAVSVLVQVAIMAIRMWR